MFIFYIYTKQTQCIICVKIPKKKKISYHITIHNSQKLNFIYKKTTCFFYSMVIALRTN